MHSRGGRSVNHRASHPPVYSGDHTNDNVKLPTDSKTNFDTDSSQLYVFSAVFRKASLIAASCTIALVWIVLSVLGFLATLNVIKRPEKQTAIQTFPIQLLECFFFGENDNTASIDTCCDTLLMAKLGTKVTTLVYLVLSIFWLCIAAAFIHSLKRMNIWITKITIIWSVTTITVCVVDLVVAVLYGVDYQKLSTITSPSTDIYLCGNFLDSAAFLMSMAARGYILWLFNLIAAIWILISRKNASLSRRTSKVYNNGQQTTPRIPRVNLPSHTGKNRHGTMETSPSPHNLTSESATQKASKNPLAIASTTLGQPSDESNTPRSINSSFGGPQLAETASYTPLAPVPTSPLGPPPTHVGASPPRRHPSPNTGGGSPALRSALKKPAQPPPPPALPMPPPAPSPSTYSAIDQWRQHVQQGDNWQQPNGVYGGGQSTNYESGGYIGDLSY